MLGKPAGNGGIWREMAGFGGKWRDMAGYGGIWRDILAGYGGKCRESAGCHVGGDLSEYVSLNLKMLNKGVPCY